MQPVTVGINIARSREEVFAYLADIANHPEFTDHFLKEWRLTRADSVGRGAGARFRIAAPRRRFSWADVTFAEVQAPFRIVAVGRGGKFNRIKTYMAWTLTPAPGGGTHVELETETEPAMPSDRLLDLFGRRGWFRRRAGRALKRLQRILEENAGPPVRGARATIAGL